MGVGANIRVRRETAGLSQGYVAKLAGITQAELDAIERGEKDPSTQEIRELSAVLCCRPSELTGMA